MGGNGSDGGGGDVTVTSNVTWRSSKGSTSCSTYVSSCGVNLQGASAASQEGLALPRRQQ